VFVGASAKGDFTVSWAAPGTPGREAEGGCARRVPQSPYVPSVEQSREPPPGPPVETMPECRFNKYNATSSPTGALVQADGEEEAEERRRRRCEIIHVL
jgi:hypothetical protein